MAFSLAMLLTRRMAVTETNVAMFSYTTVGAGLASLPLALYFWQAPAAEHYGAFLFLGLLGSVAAYLVILAYRFAPAAVVAPFDYTALIWGVILGWLFWREQPQASALLGAASLSRPVSTFSIGNPVCRDHPNRQAAGPSRLEPVPVL